MQLPRLSVLTLVFRLGLLLLFAGCLSEQAPMNLEGGMTIRRSGIVSTPLLSWPVNDSTAAAISVEGDHLVIDFAGSIIEGNPDSRDPSRFTGVGLKISGHKITIRNAVIRGYKIALMAENADSLILENCDFSYNFRQRLGSTREKEDLNDWLYYHQNEKDEWKRYGAGIYLKNCQYVTIKKVTVTQGQNGIMLTGCNYAIIYNNDIRYNSGIGIGLYRSSFNQIMHNKLDFNVRGYSHGIYQRGQDSAGLLAYEQSNANIFAFNSATHSGDGFFLWAGQHTMDSGEGGCNGNIIYKNDFSYAPTNGIEVTFSSNYLVGNKMRECRYGIWGGYSFETLMKGNDISDCAFGIAIEHGNTNQIVENSIRHSQTGIKLWARDKQPDDWGFAESRDVRSRKYLIAKNEFIGITQALDITGTDSVTLLENLLDGKAIAESAGASFSLKQIDYPENLPDGHDVMLKDSDLQGRKYIFINEWGPYNFKYPSIWLREVKEDQYIFALFGPFGNWRITSASGFTGGSIQSGTFPTTLTARKITKEGHGRIDLEFIGEEFIDQFGYFHKKGDPYVFNFAQ